MKTNFRLRQKRLLLLGLALSLIGLSFGGWRGAASRQSAPPAGNQNGLAGALNADGTLRTGVSGSFDTTDFRMELTATGAPRFVAAQARCSGWDTQFSLPNGAYGNAVGALVVSGTDIYVGGGFTAIGNVAANNVAKFNLLTNTWSALGTGGGNGVSFNVNALAVSGSDLYVGGFFTTANWGGATVSANRVAKVNTTTGVWSGLGTGGGNGVDGYVTALAVSGSDLYVGGFFTIANVGGPGLSASNVAKVNTATGVWSALGAGGGNGVNSFVNALAVSGSDLYVGGNFTTANLGGATVNANRLAKFNPTTSVWSALGTDGGNGVNSTVHALAVSGSDLYVGGNFTTANLDGATVNANRVAKFNLATGAWSALGAGGGNGVNNTVLALAVNGSDLYVGGGFLTMANVGGATVSVNQVAKFNTLTNTWSGLGAGGGNGVDGFVSALAVSGSDLYAGGFFTTANVGGATVNANRLAKFNPTTGVWSALGTGGGNGVDGMVFALAVSGTDIYVGGDFTLAGNVAVNRVAKFNTLTNVWSALGTSGGNGVNFTVKALAVTGSDLYVGGFFTMANVGGPGLSVNNVAKVNTVTGVWSALGAGGGNGVSSGVLALAVSGSDLYVGGFFTTANLGGATVNANRVAKFNPATSVWSALGAGGGNGVNSFVYALAVNGSDLYVGGIFTTANVGGPGLSAIRVAKVNTATGVWSALGAGDGNGVNSDVRALAVIGSDLYVGGYFTIANVGGATVSANRVAKFNSTTGAWSALGTDGGSGVDRDVLALAGIGSDLYVGGNFTTANLSGATVSANGVAKFNPTTGGWSALADTGGGNGVNGTVTALAVSGSELLAGGGFLFAGDNKVSQNIGRFCSVSPPTITPLANTVATGSPAQSRQIATVEDAEQTASTLTVTVNGGATATVNGVTVAGLSVDAAGQVTANVAAAANATTASFTLRATDNGGLFNEAALTVNVVKYSGGIADSPGCTGPGGAVEATLALGNTGAAPLAVSATTTFTNLFGAPGSCVVAPNVGTCSVTSNGLSYTTTLAANQTVTLNYLAQVADNVAPGAQVCANNAASFGGGAPLSLPVCGTVNCPAVGPGAAPQTTSPMNDQRAGSVLIYNIFTSSTDPNRQNTRINLTNTHPSLPALAHMFFIDGATCSVADAYICLTPNQTTTFLASDLDPGTTGYIVVVAVDRQGCPTNFNYLIGDEYVKFSSGHAANLGAEAITAIAGGRPFCNENSVTATLPFDGVSYSALPHAVALDNIGSRADGNETMLILNRIGGNLATATATLTAIFGLLYDDAENAVSFSFTPGVCQFRNVLTSNLPRTAPRFENVIPAGCSGWMRLWVADGTAAITGAAINFNANAPANPNAFNQGHNLHILTLTTAASFTIPIFPPSC